MGYDKNSHEDKVNSNRRNGSTSKGKKVKTDTGEILDVVIVRLKMKSLANAQNAYEITATVQEVDVLDTSTTATALNLSGVAKSSVALSTVKSLGACAAGSAPANVMSFVGKLVK